MSSRTAPLPRAIVIGASSGIGRALAQALAAHGYAVGLAARRLELLTALQQQLGPHSRVKQIDVTDTARSMDQFRELVEDLGGADLVVVNAGFGQVNPPLDWAVEEQTIRVNVHGFAAITNAAMHYFLAQGRGQLVGISSVAAVRGRPEAPAYSASKAFMSSYLDGLRQRVFRLGLPITVTEIRPGFVDTALGQSPRRFWVASPELAARQILQAIRRRKKRAYVKRRWILVAWLMRWLPDWIYDRL
jgi:short-subunit dehydrogenase